MNVPINTVMPRTSVASPSYIRMGDHASPEGIPLGKRGMTPLLDSLAPVSPPAGGLALNYDKITGFAEYFKNSRKIETENNNERS